MTTNTRTFRRISRLLTLLAATAAVALVAGAAPRATAGACSDAAAAQQSACEAEAGDDFFVAQAIFYCGEEVKDYETFEGDEPQIPELVAIDGPFKAGRDGALPGTQFLAAPSVGAVYRQEWSPNNAEDAARVLSTSYGFGSDPELDAKG